MTAGKERQIHTACAAFLMALLLCAIAAPRALAAEGITESVTIGSFTLNRENPFYKNGGTAGTAFDYNASFDANSGTLVLCDLDVETKASDAISAAGKLNLVLKGTNTVRVHTNYNNERYYTCAAFDDVMVSGTGTLVTDYSTQTASGRCNSYGITADTLTMESGTIFADYAYVTGISATKLILRGGEIRSDYAPISVTDAEISGGTLVAETIFTDAFALKVSGALSVSGGVVSAGHIYTSSVSSISAQHCVITGGRVSTENSNNGISAGDGIYISGGVVSAKGIYYGIKSSMIQISGGTVTAACTNTAAAERGAMSSEPLLSSCGTYVLKTGRDQSNYSTTATVGKAEYANVHYDSIGAHTEENLPAAEPTCTESGYTAGTRCTKCGVAVQPQRIISPTGHKYDRDVVTDAALHKQATCTAAAQYRYSCSCGKVNPSSYSTCFSHGEALGHDWGDWVDKGNGTHRRDCDRTSPTTCYAYETGKHDWGNWSDNGDGTHAHSCLSCSAAESGNHSWGTWSDNGDGTHTRNCGACSAAESGEHGYANGACSACAANGLTISAENGTVTASALGMATDAAIWAAVYTADNAMIACTEGSAGEGTLAWDVSGYENADHVRIFILGDGWLPLHSAAPRHPVGR